MNKKLYPKLAAMNLRKNSKLYTPYILTCIGTVMLYYVISALSRSRSLESMAGGSVLKSILGFGSVVVALFSAVFLFYTNSFLIKRRKKEIGLFNILGMGKRHIAGVMVFETLYTAFLGLFFGLFLGILFSGILCWLLPIWLRFDVALQFETPVSSVLETAAFFFILFLLILLHTLRQIHLAKPVELLKGGQTGEKEPKAKWLLALFGALCLGGGVCHFYFDGGPHSGSAAVFCSCCAGRHRHILPVYCGQHNSIENPPEKTKATIIKHLILFLFPE